MKRTLNERLDQIEALIGNQTWKPLNMSEAAEYLNISKSYLYRLTSTSIIPHYQPGGKKIYFDKRDLDRYLQRRRVSSREEIRKDVE